MCVLFVMHPGDGRRESSGFQLQDCFGNTNHGSGWGGDKASSPTSSHAQEGKNSAHWKTLSSGQGSFSSVVLENVPGALYCS